MSLVRMARPRQTPPASISHGRHTHALCVRLSRASPARVNESAGTSPSTIARLEKGEPGIGIGTLADVLIVLGLAERLAGLVDTRLDEVGMALTDQSLPKRGRTSVTARRGKRGEADVEKLDQRSDPDGVAF